MVRPTQVGTYKFTVSCRDELGNIYNYAVSFLIGSDNAIAAADFTEYYVSDGENGHRVSLYYPYSSYVTGGSGSYEFEFVSSAYGLSIDKNSGWITGRLAAGTYKIKLKLQTPITAVCKLYLRLR